MGSSESTPFALLSCVALALPTEQPFSHLLSCPALPSLLSSPGAAGSSTCCRDEGCVGQNTRGVKPQLKVTCRVFSLHANSQRRVLRSVLSLWKRLFFPYLQMTL